MGNRIKLPNKFEIIVSGSDYEVPIKHALQNFSQLLDQTNSLFPEYTDHSSDHIQDVLDSAASIITDESFIHLTAEDIYVLAIAVCLHDCGMTLGWAELKSILTDNKYNGKVYSYRLGEETNWIKLWEEFKNEYKNFTPRELKDVIGDNIKLNGNLTDHFPDLTEDNLTNAQMKVAGEFVRRHHARIAHVIAVFGYPNLEIFDVFHSSAREYDDYAGLIARSHHESVRSMHDRLQENHRLVHRGCHFIFLMGVLRIADLMQITKKRTPIILYKLKTFWSNFSQREWERHLNMLGYRDIAKDPSCISFEISPELKSINELHSIRKLLEYFQLELDKLWAAMGEAYGENQVLSNLKIKYRRVESDLNHKEFVQDLPFIDTPAEFKVDLSLVGKLITPLYGNVPEIGVRELLQNGLDSIRERKHIDSTKNYKVKIYLVKEKEIPAFRIVDEGCGMDANIIKNYFLNIGSSYRHSKQWSSNFSEGSKTSVKRSGRFGIGMLAGFILGEEISVLTRRHDNESALSFSFTLEGGLIQINRVTKNETQIGTTITIKLKDNVDQHLRSNPLQWQWYFNLDNEFQEVEYYIDDQPQRSSIVFPEGYWRSVPALENRFKTFKWGTKPHHNTVSSNMLFVNSLKISTVAGGATTYKQTLDQYDENQPKNWGFDITFPPISLDDPELNLPLNLERNSFSEDAVPFGKDLYYDVVTTYLQSVHEYDLEQMNPERDNTLLNSLFFGLTRNGQAMNQSKCQIGLWGLHNNGYLFSDIALLKAAKIENILITTPYLNSSDILKSSPPNSVVFKMLNEPQFHNQYRSDYRIVHREEQILSAIRHHAFLFGIFGVACGIKASIESYSLHLNKEHYEKIDISEFLRSNSILTEDKDSDNVRLTFSTGSKQFDFPLKERDMIIAIDTSLIPDCKPSNQFTQRWLSELNSPFLNKDTKRRL